MAKVNVRTQFNFYRNVKTIVYNSEALKAMGGVVVRESLFHVERGQSPVKGYGRFAGYKIDRGGHANSYPVSVMREYPNKKKRPVNLNLSGKMLSYFTSWVLGRKIFVGFNNTTPQYIRDRVEAHNFGTNKKVPERRFFPADGQEFKPAIVSALKKVLREYLDKAVRST